jgi:hypothetical protein
MAEKQNLISQFYLEVEGMGESPLLELQRDLLSVTVESSLHLPDVATLRISDTSLRWIDEKSLEPGKRLKVSAKGRRASRSSRCSRGRSSSWSPTSALAPSTSTFGRSTRCTGCPAGGTCARSRT